jgi:DDE family transposase
MIAVVEAADHEGAVPVDAFCPVDEQISAGVSRDLFAVLDGLPDPRRTGWRRHRLGYVLAVVFTAFCLPGFASLAGAAQWAADPARGRRQLLALGAWPDPLTGRVSPPSEPTIRAILSRIDPDALTRACVAWTLAHREPDPAPDTGTDPDPDPDPDTRTDPDDAAGTRTDASGRGQQMARELTALAMDGKCARGARRSTPENVPNADTAENLTDPGSGQAPMFFAAVTHDRPMVVAQRQIPTKTSEIRGVATLLADLQAVGWDLASTVITLDALHTVRETATKIMDTGAHYLMIVKRNRADLYDRCAQLIATADPDQLDRHTTTGRGHGRTEERILAALPLIDTDGIDFPGAAQVLRIVRYTGGLDGQRTTKEVVCLRSAADGGFWDMSGRCAQVSGLRLAFHHENA